MRLPALDGRKLAPGEGVIHLAGHGARPTIETDSGTTWPPPPPPPTRASFSTLQFSYPLKLIVPARTFFPGHAVQVLYVLSYGGGLVAGDEVRLAATVDGGATLVMLTQGSTKVFKTRPGRFLSSTSHSTRTVQSMHVNIAPRSTLVLLPCPVTCFSRADYAQRQTFELADETSSCVVLDWFTSGRASMNSTSASRSGGGEGGVLNDREEWSFTRYKSSNEFRQAWPSSDTDQQPLLLAKDVMLLEDESDTGVSANGAAVATGDNPTRTTYATRVRPYSCYATLVIFGPAFDKLLDTLDETFSALTQYKMQHPFAVVWSFSRLDKNRPGSRGVNVRGGIARCAGATTELVKEWILDVLHRGGVESVVGPDLTKVAFM